MVRQPSFVVKDDMMHTNRRHADEHPEHEDGWARLWRHMRRADRPLTPDQRWCSASGWHLNSGCTDGDGATVCPRCSRTVRTATAPHGVEVIQAHCA